MKNKKIIIAGLFIFVSSSSFAQDLLGGKIEVQCLFEEVFFNGKNHALFEGEDRIKVNYNLVLTESSFLYVDTNYKSSVVNFTIYSNLSFRDELKKHKNKSVIKTTVNVPYVRPDSLVIIVDFVRGNYRSFNYKYKGVFQRSRRSLQSMGGAAIVMTFDDDTKKWVVKGMKIEN